MKQFTPLWVEPYRCLKSLVRESDQVNKLPKPKAEEWMKCERVISFIKSVYGAGAMRFNTGLQFHSEEMIHSMWWPELNWKNEYALFLIDELHFQFPNVDAELIQQLRERVTRKNQQKAAAEEGKAKSEAKAGSKRKSDRSTSTAYISPTSEEDGDSDATDSESESSDASSSSDDSDSVVEVDDPTPKRSKRNPAEKVPERPRQLAGKIKTFTGSLSKCIRYAEQFEQLIPYLSNTHIQRFGAAAHPLIAQLIQSTGAATKKLLDEASDHATK
jgi:hypothetical protein